MVFEETHYRTEKNKINLQNGIEVIRHAVRAVVFDGNKILMAHLGKTGEYKFPGGGVKEKETTEEALIREVLEEVGYKVTKIKEKIGIITEYDNATEGEQYYFKMISQYFLAEVDDVQLSQNLEDDEKELQYKPCWVDIKEAFNKNKEVKENINKTPGNGRETIALERIIGEYFG